MSLLARPVVSLAWSGLALFVSIVGALFLVRQTLSCQVCPQRLLQIREPPVYVGLDARGDPAAGKVLLLGRLHLCASAPPFGFPGLAELEHRAARGMPEDVHFVIGSGG